MKIEEIHIRDPFILVDADKYFLYGSRGDEAWGECTGLDVYTSNDLSKWSNPVEVFSKPEDFWADMNFWAPEVHKYKGSFYMLVSFKSKDKCRGTQILISDSPMGPFRVHSEKPVTPEDWECLDGTLYIDKNGIPYMIFCHEWLQVKDGEMCAIQLSEDLTSAVDTPFLLFKASEPDWAIKNSPTFVTDGPFMHRLASGELLMLWSGFSENGYVEAIAYSDNGEISGKWKHKDRLLFSEGGGHGMLFTSKNGDMMFVLHSPNDTPLERPHLKKIHEENGTLAII